MSAPPERRFARQSYLALALATLLALALAAMGDLRPFGVEVPFALPLVLALAGAATGALAARRRSGGLALAACALLALAVVPAGRAQPGLAGYGLGLLFALALLCYGELVHMAKRQERAKAAVAKEPLAADQMGRVGSEALRTLALRAGLAGGLAALGVLLAFLLALAGPLRLREAVETRAPLGVAVASLALLGGLALLILVRGAFARPGSDSKESAPDAAD